MNIHAVFTLLARLLLWGGMLLILPLIVAIYYGESLTPFLWTMILAFLPAVILHRRRHVEPRLTIKDSIAVTALAWISVSFIYLFPYVWSGVLTPLSAWTESVSGLTGTGATVFADLNQVPKSLLFFRSLTHWIGGLGIIVVFMALFPPSGKEMTPMMSEESTGPTSYRTVPRIKEMAKALFKVYFCLTVLAGLIFFLLGMTPFDAINHSMSAIATGGFSTHNESVAYYNNGWLKIAILFFMVISAANFGLYVAAWKKDRWILFKDREFRVFLLLWIGASLLIFLNLTMSGILSGEKALIEAFFTSGSVASTTGFVSADFDNWPAFSRFLLLLLMIIGGCGGSTSGGLKATRLILLVESVYMTLRQRIHPEEVRMIKIGDTTYRTNTLLPIFGFFFFYIGAIFICALLLTIDGYISISDALGLSIAAMSNTGPALGQFGATCNWADMSAYTKIIISIAMLLGRLESFTLLAICFPSFWKKSRW